LNTSDQWQEILKAFALVDEYDQQRPKLIKQYRLYYNEDGSVIGLWETGHPEGDNYIVLADPDVFHRNNSQLLRVVNKELKIIDPRAPNRVKLTRSDSGQAVIKGMAALPLNDEQTEYEIEYYDRKNN